MFLLLKESGFKGLQKVGRGLRFLRSGLVAWATNSSQTNFGKLAVSVCQCDLMIPSGLEVEYPKHSARKSNEQVLDLLLFELGLW